MTLYGVDFTSAPRPAKGIVVAGATATAAGKSGDPLESVRVHSLERLGSFEAFDRWLQTDGPWVGAFDLPFGLPRELMADWGWCCLLYTSPSPRDRTRSRMPSSA